MCEVFHGISDAEVLEIFARVNTYSVPLNRQELLNGKYFGFFKQSAYKLAYEHLEFWRRNGIYSETAIARMSEVELTSELMIVLTDGMQQKIEAIIAKIDAVGGMAKAVEQGMVQRMIGESAFAAQHRIERGEDTVVGVNKYQVDENPDDYSGLEYPERSRIDAHLAALKAFKASRSNAAAASSLDALARAAQCAGNVFAAVVEAADAGATHGEICACLRRELGFGQPLSIV